MAQTGTGKKKKKNFSVERRDKKDYDYAVPKTEINL
jgi:hypothetical protein